MKKLLMALLFVAPLTAFADNCDKPSNDFDGLYCLNKVYIESDKELNVAYKKLKKYLKKSEKSDLKHGQIVWMKERNSDCTHYDDRGFFINLHCATTQTVDRTRFLDDRIRECKATGCQPSKL